MNKLKVLFLAEARSAHTLKWAMALSNQGIDVSIFSLFDPLENNYNDIPVFSLSLDNSLLNRNQTSLKKIVYFKSIFVIKRLIAKIKPHILHAHFASSYGILGNLSRFHPYILSVWGSDVFDFPNRSIVNRLLFKYNLRNADEILSTSKYMADATKNYTKKKIHVTPFGVDLNKFKPLSIKKDNSKIIIGIIKNLEKIYGHVILLKAFKQVLKMNKNQKLKLLIVGDGTEKDSLIKFTNQLNIKEYVEFAGRIGYSTIEYYHNMMDIEVYPSIIEESFGVSILEASACQKPVVVSKIGGMPEVVNENVTGLLVKPNDVNSLVHALNYLIQNRQVSVQMGIAGRKWVQENYNLEENVKQMIRIYETVLLKNYKSETAK